MGLREDMLWWPATIAREAVCCRPLLMIELVTTVQMALTEMKERISMTDMGKRLHGRMHMRMEQNNLCRTRRSEGSN